jgi:superfamily II DNA or RNA helicase
MSAEVFSNALFKIVTPCMLGLSATMTRKDGLSKVFKMFIGGVVAKKKRDDGGRVIVRVKSFSSPDEEFNRAELDFRGQVKYATMISKVHEFGPRVEFVASTIRDIVDTEEEGRQLLVLAQNRCLLTSLMTRATAAGIDTGYYVGGMKEKDLDKSAKCRVILATYGMAEEALDIKGLSTLILASPRTSVEQAVGRILRTKEHTPIVYDVVDQHEVFRRQWKKRLKFYQKNNYTVESDATMPTAVSGKQEIQQGVCYV